MVNKKIMKIKKEGRSLILVLSLLALFSIFVFLSFVSATEACYNQVTVGEMLVYDATGNVSDIALSYLGGDNLYGNYVGSVNEYHPDFAETYLLKVFSSSGTILGEYSFGTSLITFYDNFGNETDPGGMMINDEGQTSVIFPYFSSAVSVGVYFNNTEKFRQSVSFSCNRDCALENEIGSSDGFGQVPYTRCCSGLQKIIIEEHSTEYESWYDFACVECGDGVCSQYEDYRSCWEDCKPDFTCSYGTVPGEYGCVEPESCGDRIVQTELGEECDGEENCTSDCYWIIELNETINETIYSCKDYDGFLPFFRSLFVKSFVLANDSTHYDSCRDENNVVENYCGFDLRFDFWNIKRVLKNTTRECENGCYNGKCSQAPVVVYPISGLGCSSDLDCYSNQFCEFEDCFASRGTCTRLPQNITGSCSGKIESDCTLTAGCIPSYTSGINCNANSAITTEASCLSHAGCVAHYSNPAQTLECSRFSGYSGFESDCVAQIGCTLNTTYIDECDGDIDWVALYGENAPWLCEGQQPGYSCYWNASSSKCYGAERTAYSSCLGTYDEPASGYSYCTGFYNTGSYLGCNGISQTLPPSAFDTLEVCGCDDITYVNDYYRLINKVSKLKNGACDAPVLDLPAEPGKPNPL